ncbi:MAG: hypothetical protein JO185_08065 [Acidobacteriaceae bacterium]|nr:hypothetical protein [Acidobacteriaceae bacterium]
MTLTIELPERQETALKAKAQAQGLSAEEYARQVLAHDLEGRRKLFRAFLEIFPKPYGGCTRRSVRAPTG